MAKLKIDRIKIKQAGARAVMKSPGVQADLARRASAMKAIADGMGSGTYSAKTFLGKVSAHAIVGTTDVKSMASNRKHNTLLKSLDAGR